MIESRLPDFWRKVRRNNIKKIVGTVQFSGCQYYGSEGSEEKNYAKFNFEVFSIH